METNIPGSAYSPPGSASSPINNPSPGTTLPAPLGSAVQALLGSAAQSVVSTPSSSYTAMRIIDLSKLIKDPLEVQKNNNNSDYENCDEKSICLSLDSNSVNIDIPKKCTVYDLLNLIGNELKISPTMIFVKLNALTFNSGFDLDAEITGFLSLFAGVEIKVENCDVAWNENNSLMKIINDPNYPDSQTLKNQFDFLFDQASNNILIESDMIKSVSVVINELNAISSSELIHKLNKDLAWIKKRNNALQGNV